MNIPFTRVIFLCVCFFCFGLIPRLVLPPRWVVAGVGGTWWVVHRLLLLMGGTRGCRVGRRGHSTHPLLPLSTTQQPASSAFFRAEVRAVFPRFPALLAWPLGRGSWTSGSTGHQAWMGRGGVHQINLTEGPRSFTNVPDGSLYSNVLPGGLRNMLDL